jgi:putative molybdopterin biosynthesis protein
MEPKEFHQVVSIEEAKRRLAEHAPPRRRIEEVPLRQAAGRVLGRRIVADVDVPPFDRAAMDGYAVVAQDTFYADEERPVEIRMLGYIPAGEEERYSLQAGECFGIATGAPIPKGANAVVMVEYTQRGDGKEEGIQIFKPVAPGENIMPAGSDIMRGETVLREGTLISPRETGVMAALGMERIPVFSRPRVAIFSTGDEILPAGEPLSYGKIYDVNSQALADAVRENGGDPSILGIIADDPASLSRRLREALEGGYDLILTSGGTSAGVGDIAYRIIDDLGDPGVLVHGIAIKPGKPTVIGAVAGRPIFGLPGYPTSAMIVFDVLVAPWIRSAAGLAERERKRVRAKTSLRLFSARGRHEYLTLHLVRSQTGDLSAYPILTGSGAITTLAEADGYVEIPENREMIPEGTELEVILLSEALKPVDLTIIGSHCLGIDSLLQLLQGKGPFQAKVINVGSAGGLQAVKRGEADIAGTHLLDEETGEYNVPFLQRYGITDSAYLVRGYRREQGLVFREGNPLGIQGIRDLTRPEVSFINRNPGSGTRVLLDIELRKVFQEEGREFREGIQGIKGYEVEAKSHSAVAAAVAFGRADVGIAIRTVAHHYGLGFLPLREERYDFAVPEERMEKEAVAQFLEALRSQEFRDRLEEMPGLLPDRDTGRILHSPR